MLTGACVFNGSVLASACRCLQMVTYFREHCTAKAVIGAF